MKSLRSTGIDTAARTASRSASEPWKRRSSVSTLMTRAPPLSYARPARPDRRCWRSSPVDGLARFTSAITPMPGSRSAAITSRGGGAASAAALTSAKSRRPRGRQRRRELLRGWSRARLPNSCVSGPFQSPLIDLAVIDPCERVAVRELRRHRLCRPTLGVAEPGRSVGSRPSSRASQHHPLRHRRRPTSSLRSGATADRRARAPRTCAARRRPPPSRRAHQQHRREPARTPPRPSVSAGARR